MKQKEYNRLAKISLKANKKTTRSTVRGISFGLILLVPIIFVTMGIYIDMDSQLNKNPQLLFGYGEMIESDYYINGAEKTEIDYRSGGQREGLERNSSYPNVKELGAFRESIDSTVISGNIYTFVDQLYEGGRPRHKQYSIDGEAYKDIPIPKDQSLDGSFSNDVKKFKSITVFDNAESDKYFAFGDGSGLATGFDKGFSNGGAGQVVLADWFVELIGKQPADVYGKKFSLQYVTYKESNHNCFHWYAEKSGREVLCKEYEVVGVTTKEFDEIHKGGLRNYGLTDMYSSGMYFTENSLYNADGDKNQHIFKPHVSTNNGYDRGGMDYTQSWTAEEKELYSYCLNINYAGLIVNMQDATSSNYAAVDQKEYASIKSIVILPASYQDLTRDVKSFFKLDRNGTVVKADRYIMAEYTSDTYSNFYGMSNMFTYISLVMLALGGIIFFAAMVNLFNSLVHSVDSRKHYLGVLRAIGARNKVIPRMYITETFTILNRAVIFVAIFSTIISVGFKILIDYLMGVMGEAGFLTVSIGWEFIPIALLMVVAVLYLIGFLFAYFCSRKIAVTPITEVLSKE